MFTSWKKSTTPRWQTIEAANAQPKPREVAKKVVEEGVLLMMAAGAAQQQKQDFDAARTFYAAALQKADANKINRRRLLQGTAGKPPPLNTHTPLEWSLLTKDVASAVVLQGNPNALLECLPPPRDLRMLREILSMERADVDHRVGTNGRALLHTEAAAGRLAGVKLALEFGAQVRGLDNNAANALCLALQSNSTEGAAVVRLLLELGLDPRGCDGKGRSMLQLALASGAPAATLAPLLAALKPFSQAEMQAVGAWLDQLNNEAIGTAAWPREARTRDILTLILDEGISLRNFYPRLLAHALYTDSAPFAQRLAASMPQDSNLGPVAADWVQAFITSFAQRDGFLSTRKSWTDAQEAVIGTLLRHGLNPNTRGRDTDDGAGCPLLVAAVYYGRPAIAQLLIAQKVDVNRTYQRVSALSLAQRMNNPQLVAALKSAGAKELAPAECVVM